MPERPIELVLATAKRGAEKVQRGFAKPDDDWRPVMVGIDRSGRGHVMGTGWDDHEGKVYVATVVLPSFIRRFSLRATALVTSAWMVKASRLEPGATDEAQRWYAEHGGLSTHPDRQELLLISAMDALQQKSLAAPIKRYQHSPPRLARWETWDGPDVSFEGLMADDIRRALAPQG